MKSGILGSIMLLFFSRTAGQAIVFLIAPILSRLLDPADYGAAGYVLSLGTMGAIVATLRYDLKFVVLRSAAAKNNLFFVCLIFVTAVGLVALAATLLGGLFRSEAGRAVGGGMLLSVAPIIWTNALYNQVVPNYLTAFGAFGTISFSALVCGVVTAALQLGMAWADAGPMALVVGRIVGAAAGIVAMVAPLYRSRFATIGRAVSGARMRRLAVLFRRQALVLLPSDLFNTGAAFLPVFVLPIFFGIGAGGSYYFMFTIAGTVLKLYSSSIRPIMSKKYSDMIKKGRPIQRSILRMTAILALGSSLSYALFCVVGLPLFTFVFGQKWHEAGTFLIASGLYYAVTIVHVPVAGLVAVLDLQKTVLLTEAAQFLAVVLALASALTGVDALTVVWSISIICACVYLVSLAVLLRQIGTISNERT